MIPRERASVLLRKTDAPKRSEKRPQRRAPHVSIRSTQTPLGVHARLILPIVIVVIVRERLVSRDAVRSINTQSTSSFTGTPVRRCCGEILHRIRRDDCLASETAHIYVGAAGEEYSTTCCGRIFNENKAILLRCLTPFLRSSDTFSGGE